ncbi:Ig-like domain-containing protein [Colwellia psychrerythraea]|uniref:Ig domain protein group 2 domain protein n=1 Tax=Colwellia psychrerythraea TaxID=28229 RepID=A0A099KJM9_COLPS|nr:Ig-like domain-containing protein [Colwellia psychrerythraea]KGJ90142.1 Ig domain protein group 2 domain protein [Colwellia psychrerythraea]
MFNFINKIRGLLLITLLCLISACGSDGGGEHYVTEVNLTADKTTFPAGVSQTIEGQAIYNDGEISDASSGNSLWTSDDETIAVVDNKGVVTGVSAGTVLINANYLGGDGTASGAISITITEAVLLEIEIIPSNKSVPLGLHMKYQAIGTYSDNTEHILDNNSDISWSSSDATVATIDSASAIADTLKIGETTISVGYQNLISTSVLNVTNESLVRLVISPEMEGETSVPDGYKIKFTAEATYTNDSKVIVTDDVTWHSTDYLNLNPTSPNGTFEGIEPSMEEVTATLDLITSNAISVTVTDSLLESVAIESNEPSYPIGLPKQLIATGLFSDGSEKDIAKEANVNWLSKNTEIATVNNDGVLMPISMGKVVIQVTTEDDNIYDEKTFDITAAELTATIVISPADILLAPGEFHLYVATGLYTDNTLHILNGKPGINWSLSYGEDPNYNEGVSIDHRGVLENQYQNSRALTQQVEVNVKVDGFSNTEKTYVNLSATKVLGVSGNLSFVSPFSVTDAALLEFTSSIYQTLTENGVSGPENGEFVKLTQQSATTECANLVYNRHDDYRLPTSSELMSLWTTYDNSGDDDYQLYTEQKWSVGEYFWTSEPGEEEGSFKIVDLREGIEGNVSVYSTERYFSCVRDTAALD